MLITLTAPLTLVIASYAVFGLARTGVLLLATALSVTASCLAITLWLRSHLPKPQKGTIAFFHPSANGGGGGERVLWCAVAALLELSQEAQVVVYSGEGLTAEQLLQNAADNFNINVPANLRVVQVTQRHLLDPAQYPRFTMVEQAMGSVRLAYEALQQVVPEVWVDTAGWAFTYPLASMAGCSAVAAYVHYPTISTDMLDRIQSGSAAFNNDAAVAGSTVKSAAKLGYYYAFATLYGAAGAYAKVVMVNSSWTGGHIRSLWWRWGGPRLVFPPADTASLQALPLDRKLKRLYLVSVAQFRPEKNHALQLRAYALARQHAIDAPGTPASEAVLASRLKLIGSSRHEEDRARVEQLRELARELGAADSVDFCVNVSYGELRQLLGGAVGGLHTMQDEHFGISIVEYMAAGVIPIANDSGGPKEDIMRAGEGELIGYLCMTAEQYADVITEVLSMDQVSRLKIAAAARRRAGQFSDDRFKREFLEAIAPALPAALYSKTNAAKQTNNISNDKPKFT